jgi:hypothetical protein
MRLRIPLSIVAMTALSSLVAATSVSASTLDQQQPSSSPASYLSIGSSQSLAESFTAGISGGLDRVDLLLYKIGSPTTPVTVEIRNLAGAPGVEVLAIASIPASAIGSTGAFVPVTFGSPAPVTAGFQYAIVAYGADPSNSYQWTYATGNPYPGGALFLANSSPPGGTWNVVDAADDFSFKTYVIPSSSGPTGQRAAALASCKKRAKKHHWSHQRLRKCKKKANLLPL